MKISSAACVIPGVLLFLAASAPAQDYKAILANPERPEAERAADAVRKPEEMLKFFGVKTGDKVGDLMASSGYYTAILSQVVGDKGVVYSANPTIPLFGSSLDKVRERFKNPLYKNVKLLEGDMGAVALPQDGSLDFVLINLDYHEVEPASRAGMNQRVFGALKPGGVYGVVDHASQEGTGDTVRKTLHRIDKGLVVKEVTGAGFKSAKEGEMLKNPDDPRTGSPFKEQRGKTDRFVLRFEKPK
jgi:predicted methyltransferase